MVRKKGEIIHEHEFNRAVAKYCDEALRRNGFKTMFTADMKGNTDVPLSTRASKANNAKADILVSFHYNAVGSCASFQSRVKGLLVLRTKNCSSKSITLGEKIHKRLMDDCKYSYTFGVRRDVDVSGFTLAILRQTNMPAVLVEYGFMDYFDEAKLMLDKNWQKKCAEATCKGICDFFGVKYKAPETKKETSNGNIKVNFVVRILPNEDNSLNVRKGPGLSYAITGTVKPGDAFTIVETTSTGKWGKLKSGLGWINISSQYVQKL